MQYFTTRISWKCSQSYTKNLSNIKSDELFLKGNSRKEKYDNQVRLLRPINHGCIYYKWRDIMQGNTVADYMIGNTKIVIKDAHYAASEECEQIYERISRIVAKAYLRKQKEKDI